MQGYPLAMVTYGIGVILMIKQLKAAYTNVTRPWYDDNAGALGTYDNIQLYFNSLKQFGMGHGYFTPNPQKAF